MRLNQSLVLTRTEVATMTDKKTLSQEFEENITADIKAESTETTESVENTKNMENAEKTDARRRKSPKGISQPTRDAIRAIVVLAALAVVAGVLLGVVNYFTYTDPDSAITSKIAEYYSVSNDSVKSESARVINEEGEKSEILSCYSVWKDNEMHALVYRVFAAGSYSGGLELLVYVEKSEIMKIAVYSQSETQGIGSKVLSDAHLEKYNGINLASSSKIVLTKEEPSLGEVTAISGATKTSRAVNNAVNAIIFAYQNFDGVSQ